VLRARNSVPAGRYGDPRQGDKRGRYRGRAFASFVVLALAVGVIATGCSSGTSTSSGTGRTTSTTSALAACQAANSQFDLWLSKQDAAVTADKNTTQAWVTHDKSFTASEPAPSSPELTAAINEFNTNNQTAQAARMTASEALAAYQVALQGCNQSSLPTACQGDFAQHQPLIDAATRLKAAKDAEGQAIVARQQAYRSGDVNALNAQVVPANAAVAAFDTATNDFTNASSGHTTAASSCLSALPTPAPTPAGRSRVTKANYDAIRNGMTLAQVEQILGPNQTGGSPGGAELNNETLYIWYAGEPGSEPDISVWFGTDGRVTSKDQTGLK
jgi:hypothetical protein